MSTASITLLVALAACAHGAAVDSGRSLNPMVWPMPQMGIQLVKPQIIGGEDAKLGEFPHQVSMQVSMLWILEQHICGGTLIAPDWVLTAAHCIKGVPWYTSAFILAGKANLAKKEEGQQRSAVKKMLVHEKYDSHKQNGVGPFDIGLLHLKTPLQYSDTIQPAHLPVQGEIPDGIATLTGWGSVSTTTTVVIPDELQKLDLPIIPFEKCYDFVNVASFENHETNPLADTNICVGNLEVAGTGSCSGDSGGPLVQTQDGKVVVLGATSWGYFPCANEPSPSVYTRVSAYVDWINNKMSAN